jgi:hypothetical protein
VAFIDIDQVGRAALARVERQIDLAGGAIGRLATDLLRRHGYEPGPVGGGPHLNVLGHPLFELPIWLDCATRDGPSIGTDVLLGIHESSLCGYLSVRVEDDFFDERHGAPEEVMIVSGFFRSRHQALLARTVSHPEFWDRFEAIWHRYGEAMLFERSLHDGKGVYGADEFDLVLDRSQPLEIPAAAVLSLKGRWDLAEPLSGFVRHLVRATQLFNDLIDAPADLEAGNYTWLVRRLGGINGAADLRRGIVKEFDQVVTEAGIELDLAMSTATSMGMTQPADWVDARRQLMLGAAERMYTSLFTNLAG